MIPTIEQIFEARSTDTIHIFDIDDTILYTQSKIYFTEPGKKEKAVGTFEFSEIRASLHPDTIYDWKDFMVFDRIVISMKSAKPNIPILELMDKAIQDGYKIGILTARGNQKAVWAALQASLLYRNKKGILESLPVSQFQKKFCFAVGDPDTKKFIHADGSMTNPSNLKAKVLQKIFGDTYGFSKIFFYDDDSGNVKAAEALNDPRIKAIKV